jgi:hypothetical protein
MAMAIAILLYLVLGLGVFCGFCMAALFTAGHD